MKRIAKSTAILLAVFVLAASAFAFAAPMRIHAAEEPTGGITMAKAQEILGITDGSEPYVYEYTNSLGNAFKAIAGQEKGGILLIKTTANFSSSFYTTTAAEGKTVIITSYYVGTYGGKTYDTDYRETGACLRFYTSSASVVSFSMGLGMNTYMDGLRIVNGKGSSNAKILLCCNWNDLYIGKDVTCTAPGATASQAFPAVVAGYDRDKSANGAAFPAGKTQNITIESGSFCYVAGGDMATSALGAAAKPLNEVAGSINITLNGGYYYGESAANFTDDRYGFNSLPSVLARCFARYTDSSSTHLVIGGGEYQSAIFGYGITQDPTKASNNKTAQAGTLTMDIWGGRLAGSRIRLDASTYAGTTASLADTRVVANIFGGEPVAPTLYVTTTGLTAENATVNWLNNGSAMANNLAKPASQSGDYVKNELSAEPAVFTLPDGVTPIGEADGIVGALIVRDAHGAALAESAYTVSGNTVTAQIAQNPSVGTTYSVGIHAADGITVCTFRYTGAGWECSAPVVDTTHKAETYFDNRDLVFGCKQCGSAGRITAQHDENGAPVVFAALTDPLGSALPLGHGLTPASPVNNVLQVKAIFDTYKANAVLPACTVVVVGVLAPGADFEIDYGAPVTFTSVWKQVNYGDDGARLRFAYNGHFRSDTTFKSISFEHIANSLSFLAMNGNNLTITDCGLYNGAPYCEDLSEGSASYSIVSGEFLDSGHKGVDLTNLDQTIRIDSGIWRSVDVGNYRATASSAFTKMNGKVTVDISGNVRMINISGTPAYMYRGLSACSQILSDDLTVVYNISGGSFKFGRGLNVIGRDAQAPAAGSVRNIHATYNISGGNFYTYPANAEPVTAESLPTSGSVTFNIAPDVYLGAVTIDPTRDRVNWLMAFTNGSFSFSETDPCELCYSVHIPGDDRSFTFGENGIELVEYGMLTKRSDNPAALEYIAAGSETSPIGKCVAYQPGADIDLSTAAEDGFVFTGSVPITDASASEEQSYSFRPYAVYARADGSVFVSYGATATSRVNADMLLLPLADGRVALLASIDSLNYAEVGFEVTFDGETKRFTTDTAYTVITNGADVYTAETFGAVGYVYGILLENVPAYTNYSITAISVGGANQ